MQIAPATLRPLLVPPQGRTTRGEIGGAQPIDPVTAVTLFEKNSTDRGFEDTRRRGRMIDLYA